MTTKRYYERTISCEYCGGIFAASRYDAKYCSALCRQRAGRAEKRLHQTYALALEALSANIDNVASADRTMALGLIQKCFEVLSAKRDRYDW